MRIMVRAIAVAVILFAILGMGSCDLFKDKTKILSIHVEVKDATVKVYGIACDSVDLIKLSGGTAPLESGDALQIYYEVPEDITNIADWGAIQTEIDFDYEVVGESRYGFSADTSLGLDWHMDWEDGFWEMNKTGDL